MTKLLEGWGKERRHLVRVTTLSMREGGGKERRHFARARPLFLRGRGP
jgi:hypothetical protein